MWLLMERDSLGWIQSYREDAKSEGLALSVSRQNITQRPEYSASAWRAMLADNALENPISK